MSLILRVLTGSREGSRRKGTWVHVRGSLRTSAPGACLELEIIWLPCTPPGKVTFLFDALPILQNLSKGLGQWRYRRHWHTVNIDFPSQKTPGGLKAELKAGEPLMWTVSFHYLYNDLLLCLFSQNCSIHFALDCNPEFSFAMKLISVLAAAVLPLFTAAYSSSAFSAISSLAKRDLVSTILDDIEHELTCDSCEVKHWSLVNVTLQANVPRKGFAPNSEGCGRLGRRCFCRWVVRYIAMARPLKVARPDTITAVCKAAVSSSSCQRGGSWCWFPSRGLTTMTFGKRNFQIRERQ